MVRIEAEWALWSKRPGERDDYSVLGCSHGRYQSTQFKEIIERFTPGTPDEPEALPRVTLSWVGASDDIHLGLAIQTWTGDKDGVGRDIAETRYFCVPYRQLGEQVVSYVGLYKALKDVSPLDHGSRLIGVDVPELDPGRIAGDVTKLGEHTVRQAAALLLVPRRPVCVVRAEQLGPVDRLRFLDAVISLLPYGYRTRFTASTWTNSGTRHRIRLSFARRARDEANAVIWGGSGHVPHDEQTAITYFDRLGTLLSGDLGSGTIRRLAADTEPRRFEDPAPALETLRRIERPNLVVERIQANDGDPDETRELVASGQIRDLRPDDQRRVLAYLIGLGDNADFGLIEKWLPIVAEHDPAPLVGSLIETAKRLLWAPSSQRVGRYLVFATPLGRTDEFLSGVILPPASRENLEGGLASAADLLYEEVVATEQTSLYPKTLVALSKNQPLVCELIARLADDKAPHLRAGLDWLKHTKPELVLPFRELLVPRSASPPSRDDIELLARNGRSCVRALLAAASHRSRLHHVIEPFIDWLNVRGPLTPDERAYWAERFGDLKPVNVAMRGALDVLRLATGALPDTMMSMFGKNWQHYADGFVTHWELELWGPHYRAQLVEGLAAHLRAIRWRAYRGRADTVLFLTGRLTKDAAPQEATQLIRAFVTSLAEAPDLSADPESRAWLEEMRQEFPPEPAPPEPHPRTKVIPSPAGQRSAPPPLFGKSARSGEQVDAIIERCVAACHHGQRADALFTELAERRVIMSGESALQVVGGLYDRLVAFGTTRTKAADWALGLASQISAGEFGRDIADDFHREVRRSSPFEMMFRLFLLEIVADRGEKEPWDLTDEDREHLKDIKERVDDLIKQRRRLLGRLRRTSRGDSDDAKAAEQS